MKIIIEVHTPGNGKTYEFTLDDKLTVGAAKEKIIAEILSFEAGCVSFDASAALFLPEIRAVLPENRNLRKAGVAGGQRLLLL